MCVWYIRKSTVSNRLSITNSTWKYVMRSVLHKLNVWISRPWDVRQLRSFKYCSSSWKVCLNQFGVRFYPLYESWEYSKLDKNRATQDWLSSAICSVLSALLVLRWWIWKMLLAKSAKKLLIKCVILAPVNSDVTLNAHMFPSIPKNFAF